MKRTRKPSVAACLRFKEVVTNYITSRGAVEDDWYGFKINTPAGRLNLAVYETWIATRFNDVEKGKAFTESIGSRCNPYSGKWNFRFGDNLNPDFVLQHFGFYFERLLAWEPISIP